MARPSKLTLEQIRKVREELRRRHELLKELAHYGVKRIAERYQVSEECIWRIEYAVHGGEQESPRAMLTAVAVA